MPERVAIVAALEHEVKPAIRLWRSVERRHDGRVFRFFEAPSAVLVCGGIGPEAARRATEAILALYSPAIVYSVGFAGGVISQLKVGELFVPSEVIDVADGSRAETGGGHGSLLSLAAIATKSQKLRFAEAYGASAVDMEAAAVARGAEAKGVAFGAVKAISDEVDFEMPSMHRAIDSQGNLRTARLLMYALVRPWTWPSLIRLARDSAKAAQTLAHYLNQYNREAGILDETAAPAHPIEKS